MRKTFALLSSISLSTALLSPVPAYAQVLRTTDEAFLEHLRVIAKKEKDPEIKAVLTAAIVAATKPKPPGLEKPSLTELAQFICTSLDEGKTYRQIADTQSRYIARNYPPNVAKIYSLFMAQVNVTGVLYYCPRYWGNMGL